MTFLKLVLSAQFKYIEAAKCIKTSEEIWLTNLKGLLRLAASDICFISHDKQNVLQMLSSQATNYGVDVIQAHPMCDLARAHKTWGFPNANEITKNIPFCAQKVQFQKMLEDSTSSKAAYGIPVA